MALLSLARDNVPAWAKTALQLHRPYRTWFGFGRQRCEWCGERWGRHGCSYRESAARAFVRTATRVQHKQALASGDITNHDLHLRRRSRRLGAHRKEPRPVPGPLAECLVIAEALA